MKGFDVAVWGPSGKVEVAKRLGVRYALDMMLEVEKNDIVLVSVTIEKTVKIIREVAPHMHPGSQIMEEAARHYGGTKEARERSDRVINARIGEKGKMIWE